MKGMLLAAGMGTRLRPITEWLPKPLLPFFDMPVIGYNLDLMKSYGLREVVINLHHLSEKIMDYVGDGSRWGLRVHYTREPSILGTAGALKNAEPCFNESTFVVINSDTLRDVDLGRVIDFHRQKAAMATLVLKANPDLAPSEGLEIDSDGKIIRLTTRFIKGGSKGVKANFIGIHILNKEILDYIPKGVFYEINDQLYPGLLAKGRPIFGYFHGGYWRDLGTFESYCLAHFEVLEKRYRPPLAANETKPGIWLGKDVEMKRDVEIDPPVYIGDGSLIMEMARIGPYGVLGKGCIIGKGAHVCKAILWEGTELNERETAKEGIFGKGIGIHVNLGF